MTVTTMSSSSQLIHSIGEAVSLRSAAILERIPKEVFIDRYYADAAALTNDDEDSVQRQHHDHDKQPCAQLHEALCNVCSGGSIVDGTPSVGLGVLSAAWKHLLVPTVAAGGSGRGSVDGTAEGTRSSVVLRLIHFVFDRVRDSVLSHDWENDKDIQLSKFFASYLVAVVKAQPSMAFDAIGSLVFQLYGVVAAAVGGGGPSAKQLHVVVLVRLETVLATMGAAPHVSIARKHAALASFARRGTLEGDVEGPPPAPSSLFGAVVAHIMVATLRDVPLFVRSSSEEEEAAGDAAEEDRHAVLSLWTAMLMWLPEAALPDSPLRRWYDATAAKGSNGADTMHLASAASLPNAVVACCYQENNPTMLPLQLFTTAAPCPSASSSEDHTFAQRWLLVTSRFVVAAQDYCCRGPTSVHLHDHATRRFACAVTPLLTVTLTMCSHPLTAERIIVLWVFSLRQQQEQQRHGTGGWLLASTLMRTLIGAANKFSVAVAPETQRVHTDQQQRHHAASDCQIEYLRHVLLICACIVRRVVGAESRDTAAGSAAHQIKALAFEAARSSLLRSDTVRWVLQQVASPNANALVGMSEDGPVGPTATLERLLLFTEISGGTMQIAVDEGVAAVVQDALAVRSSNSGSGNGSEAGTNNSDDGEAERRQLARMVAAASVVHFPPTSKGGAALHAVVRAAARLVRGGDQWHDVACAALQLAGLAPPVDGPAQAVQLTAGVRMLVRSVFSDGVVEAPHGGGTAFVAALCALRGFAQHTRAVALGDLALDERIVKAFVGVLAPLEDSEDVDELKSSSTCTEGDACFGQPSRSDVWHGTWWGLCDGIFDQQQSGGASMRATKRPRGADMDDNGRRGGLLADVLSQCVSMLRAVLQRPDALGATEPTLVLEQLEQLEGQVGLVKQHLSQHSTTMTARPLPPQQRGNCSVNGISAPRPAVEVHEIED